MKNEFFFLRKLEHPSVLKVFEMYVCKVSGFVYTVMEYFEGKDVFAFIEEQPSEEKTKKVFKEILSTISYLHANGVVHRDIKPSNIKISEDGSQLKILDFNAAKFSEKHQKYSSLERSNYQMTTYTGTVAFSAPEIFAGFIYSEMVDVWSAGCVLYTMLSGHQPFYAEYQSDLIKLVKKGSPDYTSERLRKSNPKAVELVRKMLRTSPEERVILKEALEHEWFSVIICCIFKSNFILGFNQNRTRLKTKSKWRASQKTIRSLSSLHDSKRPEEISHFK